MFKLKKKKTVRKKLAPNFLTPKPAIVKPGQTHQVTIKYQCNNMGKSV